MAYTGQYDLSFSEEDEIALYDRMQHLWGDTLPKLLLAESEAEFDAILDEYVNLREEDGYEDFKAAATKLYQENKAKLGIEE